MGSWRDRRGAVLVQTGIALIGLLAFGSMSVDYGMLWVARGQAQNAADAAALAGAISLAFGDPNDLNRVRAVAAAAGQANAVWGEAPVIDPATDVIIGPCPPGAPGDPDLCVRANVYRNQERGNPLPTIFAQLVGVTAHGVKATATAQVAPGIDATCVKPWAIADKWVEVNPNPKVWEATDMFNRWQIQGQQFIGLLPTPDYYIPPTASNPGSGFAVPDPARGIIGDIGTRVRLKIESWKDNDIAAGNFQAITLPGPCDDQGAAAYRCNIETCNPTPVRINQVIESEPGGMVGPTRQGVEGLIGNDTAVWMCNNGTVASPTQDCQGYPSSANTPRLQPVVAFDVQQYMADAAAGLIKNNGRMDITVTRLLGFFIEGVDNKEVWGRFAFLPTNAGIGTGEVDESANFLRKVILVR